MDILYVVMPAYNEEANIEAVVKQWYPVLEGKAPESRLVIADSGSNDRTHEILLNLKETYPQLEVLSDTGKFHGPKVIALYDYAIKSGADYVFQTDSDGQTDPAEFDGFWQVRTIYAGIFGHRKVRGDGKSRAMVERVVCMLVKHYFKVKVPDANAPFRLLNTKVLAKYLYKLDKDYNLPNIVLTAYFVRFDEPHDFKVVTFKPRQGGVNSINIKKIFKIGWQALKDFRAFARDMNEASK